MKPNIGRPTSFERIMGKKLTNPVSNIIQWTIILATNIFFVCKYVPRVGIHPVIAAIIYGLVFSICVYVYRYWIARYITERLARIFSLLLTIGIIGFIACAIFLIDPYSIRVDRWSATTFFLDALRDGIYPYGVHTHVSETNYPSPFPLWHYLNIPFWLIGDVGWIQVFFLLVFLVAVYLYFRSWRTLLGVLLILCLSPAYWWELVTRSDGLSNALLVCSCVLMLEHYSVKMDKQWWLMAIIAGCLASTRLSTVIPVALYLFRPWLDASRKAKIGFIGISFIIILAFFAPFVFWDTDTWIFFQRNPLMSQTAPGSVWILVIMVCIAILIAYKKQTFYYYVSTTSVFMFAFMLFTQLGAIYQLQLEESVTLFDPYCDISYFTLSIPYALIALVTPNSLD